MKSEYQARYQLAPRAQTTGTKLRGSLEESLFHPPSKGIKTKTYVRAFEQRSQQQQGAQSQQPQSPQQILPHQITLECTTKYAEWPTRGTMQFV